MGEDALHLGTSGWTYASWRGRLYPEGMPQRRWLAHYSTVFDAVEINGSFYRLPRSATFEGWSETVPDGFRFAVKGSRYVTHFRRLLDPADSVALVTERARALGPKLGPILWQLRSDMELDLPRLEGFLAVLPRDLRHAIEVRRPSWLVPAVRERLADAGVALVCWDLLGEQQVHAPTADFVYLRFHGPTQKYGGSYDRALLAPWAERIRRWLDDGLAVWAFFNNDIDGHAVNDAQRLRAMLRPAGAASRAPPGPPA